MAATRAGIARGGIARAGAGRRGSGPTPRAEPCAIPRAEASAPRPADSRPSLLSAAARPLSLCRAHLPPSPLCRAHPPPAPPVLRRTPTRRPPTPPQWRSATVVAVGGVETAGRVAVAVGGRRWPLRPVAAPGAPPRPSLFPDPVSLPPAPLRCPAARPSLSHSSAAPGAGGCPPRPEGYTRRRARTALWPPKPKEFVRARSPSAGSGRGALVTTSSAMARSCSAQPMVGGMSP